MRPEHLAYFKDLLEGQADISWNAWFARHDAELKANLPRADYLRLKFNTLDEAEAALRAGGVAYEPDQAAVRRERRYALYHPSVLDERGRPLEAFRRQAYDGALGLLMDGRVDEAREVLSNVIRKVKRARMERRVEMLEDLSFDAEMEFTLGDPTIGRVMLEAVASFPLGSDQTDHPVRVAQQLLAGESPDG